MGENEVDENGDGGSGGSRGGGGGVGGGGRVSEGYGQDRLLSRKEMVHLQLVQN